MLISQTGGLKVLETGNPAFLLVSLPGCSGGVGTALCLILRSCRCRRSVVMLSSGSIFTRRAGRPFKRVEKRRV
ncbi:hypothetical protein LINPERHAP1_LOCUS6839 [Linum perenne]